MATIKLTERALATIPPAATSAQDYHWDTELKGFGIVVGRTGAMTFVARAWVGGKKRRVKIGIAGEPRELDGKPWNVTLARIEAKRLLGVMATGVDPNATKRAHRGGPTLRDALEFHVGKMSAGENRRGKVCSPRSIRTLRGGIELHLADWLDRPLVELTADALDEIRNGIEAEAERVAGANPTNPPGRAAGNRLLMNVSAVWRSWHRRHGLPVACPVERLQLRALKPRDTRVANEDLPSWHAKVMGMDNHVRRDLQIAAMFSGVRTDGLRNLRWSDIAWDGELIHIARAKGDRPYTIPMTPTLRDVLERRQTDNANTFAPLGGDAGFVFPSVSRDGKTVQAVAEVKERRALRDANGRPVRTEDGEYVRETFLPGVHVARRTYNSIAVEIGCPVETRERLLNHAGRGVNVRVYSVPQDWTLARDWAERIERAIWDRIRGQKPARGRNTAKLRVA